MTEAETDAGRGTLYGSGLIAGGAIAGLAIAALTGLARFIDESRISKGLNPVEIDNKIGSIGPSIFGPLAESDLFAMIVFVLLALTLFHYARKR